jgi:hypothetical protein
MKGKAGRALRSSDQLLRARELEAQRLVSLSSGRRGSGFCSVLPLPLPTSTAARSAGCPEILLRHLAPNCRESPGQRGCGERSNAPQCANGRSGPRGRVLSCPRRPGSPRFVEQFAGVGQLVPRSWTRSLELVKPARIRCDTKPGRVNTMRVVSGSLSISGG